MTSVLVLNGPNLNLLGTRQPEIYGHTTLADVEDMCAAHAETHGFAVTCLQSNHEGAMVDAIHAARGPNDGIVLNADANTQTTNALHAAIVGTQLPVVELHLSNIHARETFRHKSYIAPVAVGMICGFGATGYILALDALLGHLGRTT